MKMPWWVVRNTSGPRHGGSHQLSQRLKSKDYLKFQAHIESFRSAWAVVSSYNNNNKCCQVCVRMHVCGHKCATVVKWKREKMYKSPFSTPSES